MPTPLVAHVNTESPSVGIAERKECLMDSYEMCRSVVCDAKEDPEQQGPDRKLSLTNSDRQQGLYATGDRGDRGVVQDLF